MEASQQDPQEPQAQDSQFEPQQDSQLQTPQADQPVPAEEERQQQEAPVGPEATVGPSGQPAEGTVSGSTFPSNEDQQATYDQQQAELEAERQLHNERTGGGDVAEGELQAQRDEHNARTAGTAEQADAVDGTQDQA